MVRLLRPAPGFAFLCADIGVDNVSAFLKSLPPIDFLYCAPPNADWASWWRKDAGAKKGAYEDFIQSWVEIVLEIAPRECHVEVGTCRDFVEPVLDKGWPYKVEQPARYAAPSTAKGEGMVRTRKPRFTRLSYSGEEVEVPQVTDSDAFLDAILLRRPALQCFDPCLGKGLLSRFAVRHGHVCCGMDLNLNRLEAAACYVENAYGSR